jgi:hypothetical protein
MSESVPNPPKSGRTFIKTAKAIKFAKLRAEGYSQVEAWFKINPDKVNENMATAYVSASRFAAHPIVKAKTDEALAHANASLMLTRPKAAVTAQDFYERCLHDDAHAAAASALRLWFAACGVDTERTGGEVERGGLVAIVDRLKLLSPALAAPVQAMLEASKGFTTGESPVIDVESSPIPERIKADD